MWKKVRNFGCVLAIGAAFLSSGCYSKEYHKEDKFWCDDSYRTARRIAERYKIKSIDEDLNKRSWCVNEKKLFGDYLDIGNILDVNTKMYCFGKISVLADLVKKENDPLKILLLRETDLCKTGKSYKENLRDAMTLQRTIDAYKKK